MLRDYQTELRADASGNAEKIKKIEDTIDEWNNLNPEFVAYKDELTLANKDLKKLYKDKAELEKRMRTEDADVDEYELRKQLAKINDRIAEKHRDIANIHERTAPTKSLKIINDPDLKLKTKLTELFKRKGLTIGAFYCCRNDGCSTCSCFKKSWWRWG